MKKIIAACGLLAGGVVSAVMLVTVNTLSHCEGSVGFDGSLIIGYASMLLAFSLVAVGIRSYRDRYHGGVISFGKAFGVGILIVLVASTVYVLAWLIDYFVFIPDFMDRYAARTLDRMRARGASPADVAKQARELAEFAARYKNPFFNAAMTYLEILPVGLVVTTISALVLKRTAKK